MITAVVGCETWAGRVAATTVAASYTGRTIDGARCWDQMRPGRAKGYVYGAAAAAAVVVMVVAAAVIGGPSHEPAASDTATTVTTAGSGAATGGKSAGTVVVDNSTLVQFHDLWKDLAAQPARDQAVCHRIGDALNAEIDAEAIVVAAADNPDPDLLELTVDARRVVRDTLSSCVGPDGDATTAAYTAAQQQLAALEPIYADHLRTS